MFSQVELQVESVVDTASPTLTPLRVADAVPVLLAQASVWQRVSDFRRGLLYRFKEHALFISNDRASMGSFNIQLTDVDLTRLRQQDKPLVNDGQGSLASGELQIAFAQAPRYNTLAASLNPAVVACAIKQLTEFLGTCAQPTGLDCSIEALVEAAGSFSLTARELSHRLSCGQGHGSNHSLCHRLSCGQGHGSNHSLNHQSHRQPNFRSMSLSVLPALVSHLMGKGQGLTPTGDDFLVGMLAVLPIPDLRQAVISRAAHPDVTGLVSLNYLRAAYNGHFSHEVCQLIRAFNHNDPALITRAAGRVAEHGHSSGIDLLCGMAYALNTIQHRADCRADQRAHQVHHRVPQVHDLINHRAPKRKVRSIA